MKTFMVFLTATVVVAAASQAMADVQASDEAASYALGHGSGSSFGGAYDSAHPGQIRNSTFDVPHTYDVQAGGND